MLTVMTPLGVAGEHRRRARAAVGHELEGQAALPGSSLAGDRQPQVEQRVEQAPLGDLEPVPAALWPSTARSGITRVSRHDWHSGFGSSGGMAQLQTLHFLVVAAQPVGRVLVERRPHRPSGRAGESKTSARTARTWCSRRTRDGRSCRNERLSSHSDKSVGPAPRQRGLAYAWCRFTSPSPRHSLSLRPARRALAAGRAPAARAALPDADPVVSLRIDAGRALPQLAAGSAEQLSRAARVPRAGPRVPRRGRSRRRDDGQQPVRLLPRAGRRDVPVRLRPTWQRRELQPFLGPGAADAAASPSTSASIPREPRADDRLPGRR